MNDPQNRHLSEDDVAVYLDDRSNSPKEVEDHINCCADCASLVASVLECAAYEEAVETSPLTTIQKQEKISLLEKLLNDNATSVERDGTTPHQGAKKTKGQRGDWGSFFTGVLGSQGLGDLFDSGASSPVPALGDKGESYENSHEEDIETGEDLDDSGSESEEFLESPITNDHDEPSVDLDVDDFGIEDALEDNNHEIDNDASDFDDGEMDVEGIDDDSPLDW